MRKSPSVHDALGPAAEAVWRPADSQLALIGDPRACMESIDVVDGGLDVPALQSALDVVVARHAILRTRFAPDDDGTIWAVTDSKVRCPVQVFDLRSYDAARQESEARRAVGSVVEAPFDLHMGPLLRVAVVRMAGRDLCVLAAHHAIFDGWSRDIFRREVAALYTGALAGRPAALPDLPVQYYEHAFRQATWLRSEAVGRHLEYWRNKFSDAESVFSLPTDAAAATAAHGGAPPPCGSLSGHALEGLRRQAADTQRTTFTFTSLVAAFGVVLASWSGRRDVVTWVVNAGRSRPDLQRLIGCFLSSWPLRMDLSGDVTFRQVATRIQAAYVEALPHSDVTVGALRQDLDRVRHFVDGERFPSTAFNYVGRTFDDNASRDTPTEVGWLPDSGRFPPGHHLAMQFNVRETNDEIVWSIQHASNLFEQTTIEAVAEAYGQVLTRVAARGDVTLDELMSNALTRHLDRGAKPRAA
jgi:hypothetical protein